MRVLNALAHFVRAEIFRLGAHTQKFSADVNRVRAIRERDLQPLEIPRRREQLGF
jgi:hypothetical protein